MTIAYVLDTYPSLSETFIAREVAALRRRGFAIEIFALQAGEGAHPLLPGDEVPLLERGRGALEAMRKRGAKPEYFRRIGAAWWHSLRRDARDADMARRIMHIHAGFASHPTDIAWGAAHAAGLPWSFSGHARDLFVEGSALREKLEAARFATACTRAGQQHLRRRAPAERDKILYAPHGLEIERYPFCEREVSSLASSLDTRPPHVLSVGRLVEKKGFAVLLEAMALLRRQRLVVNATIIGEGARRGALEKQIARLQLSGEVRLAGARPHERVQAAMRDADCFVAPSLVARDGDRDGLPNVLLEAAACGVPIVASRVGGVGDFLDETTGRLCPPGDVAALAAAIRETFDDATTTRALCRASRRRVEEQFDIERNIERLVQAFQNGSTQNGSTQNGSTQNGSTQNGSAARPQRD